MTSRRGWALLSGGLVAAVIALLLLSAYLVGWAPPPARPSGPPSFTVSDETPALRGSFDPGVILGAASNGSAAFVAGIGVYDKPTDFSLPVVDSIRNGSTGPVVTNVTSLVNTYFWEGGIYGAEWNGSAWLVVGQAGWGGGNFGAAVALQGGSIRNLTGPIFAAFAGGGVYAVGWNGSAWLIGGNSSAGLVLLSIDGGTVTNESSVLRGHATSAWVQLLAWNGAEWLIGGRGLFETWHGATITDLLPGSPFASNGVYSGSWNGSAWLVGGGEGRAVVVRDDRIAGGPTLPSAFDQVVLFLAPVDGGWLVGGKGTAANGAIGPALVYWASEETGAGITDLGARVPAAFDGGEIQGGCAAPFLGAESFLIVGEGSYDATTGFGLGAVAVVSYAEPPA